MSNSPPRSSPWLLLVMANLLFLPGELGFGALVMLCGCAEVSDGTIHWDVMAALGAVGFTCNCILAAFAYGADNVPADD